MYNTLLLTSHISHVFSVHHELAVEGERLRMGNAPTHRWTDDMKT